MASKTGRDQRISGTATRQGDESGDKDRTPAPGPGRKKPARPDRANGRQRAPRPAKREALLRYPPGHGPHEDWNEWRRYI
jgi:hypothetical protein